MPWKHVLLHAITYLIEIEFKLSVCSLSQLRRQLQCLNILLFFIKYDKSTISVHFHTLLSMFFWDNLDNRIVELGYLFHYNASF